MGLNCAPHSASVLATLFSVPGPAFGAFDARVILRRAGPVARQVSAPSKETQYGRPPHCAEVPVCSGACPRRLLVVPLRTIEKPAVLRRLAQSHRVHTGEIHRGEGRETLAVRLQT